MKVRVVKAEARGLVVSWCRMSGVEANGERTPAMRKSCGQARVSWQTLTAYAFVVVHWLGMCLAAYKLEAREGLPAASVDRCKDTDVRSRAVFFPINNVHIICSTLVRAISVMANLANGMVSAGSSWRKPDRAP